jgi:hypothetical protein
MVAAGVGLSFMPQLAVQNGTLLERPGRLSAESGEGELAREIALFPPPRLRAHPGGAAAARRGAGHPGRFERREGARRRLSRLDLRGPRAFDAAMPEELQVPGHLTVANADFGRALAFVEGRIVPLAEATVSVRDLGLMYADMTYDVVHSWRGGFFRLEDHLDRFLASCAGLRLDPGHDREGIRRILGELLRRSGLADTLVYFACTRGWRCPGRATRRAAATASSPPSRR